MDINNVHWENIFRSKININHKVREEYEANNSNNKKKIKQNFDG